MCIFDVDWRKIGDIHWKTQLFLSFLSLLFITCHSINNYTGKAKTNKIILKDKAMKATLILYDQLLAVDKGTITLEDNLAITIHI